MVGNSNKKSKVDNLLLIELFLCAAIILFTLLQKPDMASGAFMLSFIILLIWFVTITFQFKETKDSKDLLLVIFVLVLSLISILVSSVVFNAEISFDYLKEYFVFAATILFLFIATVIETNEKTILILLKINLLIGFLYPIADRFFPQNENIYVQNKYLNFSNPNLAGLWLLMSILYATISLFCLKSKLWKALAVIMLILDIKLLFETGSRNCLLALVIFISLVIWIFIKESPRFSNIFIGFMNLLPSAFLVLYLTLINFVLEKGWFDFLIDTGKPLTSRVKVWNTFIENVGNNWIFGAYPVASGNAHNSHLVLYASYGIITMVLTIIFIYKICSYINLCSKSKKNLYCLSAFFATLFTGFGEGAFFSGGMGLNISFSIFLILARYDFKDEKRVEIKKI